MNGQSVPGGRDFVRVPRAGVIVEFSYPMSYTELVMRCALRRARPAGEAYVSRCHTALDSGSAVPESDAPVARRGSLSANWRTSSNRMG